MRLASRFTDGRALAITICWVAALALTGSTDVLLFIAPALLIAIPLFGGLYIGEDLIVRLATRRTRSRSPASALAQRPPVAPQRWRPRGTGLLATSLAKRPPPILLPAQN